jgi:hypothetical protein
MRPLFSQSNAGCSGASWEGRASSYMGGSSSMLSMSSHIRVTFSCNNSDSDPMPLLLWYSASLLFSSSSLQKCKIHNSDTELNTVVVSGLTQQHKKLTTNTSGHLMPAEVETF